jgi:GNAT superfamily N-acetyltransferase
MIAGVVAADLTRELRRTVLRPQLAITDHLPGDDVPDAVHFAVLDDGGTVVSTCFLVPLACPWLPFDGPSWALRQMATRRDRQGSGAGALLLSEVINWVGVAGLIWCHARSSAIGFYERQGFTVQSEEYLETVTGLPHRDMSRQRRDR